jgi:class 3 adenylate cyclase
MSAPHEEHLQRRLATILAADVVGYSRLMAEDEEEALHTLKAYRAVIDRLIARHEGRIFNTAGDSVLAEFGSAVEAVRCAITIQEELRVRNAEREANRRMDFRIGINVGDVLVDGGNLYGDGVNVAARLEGIAAAGSICISGSVYALVKNKLSYRFEDMGPQTVKNLPEPVPAFRLTSGEGAPRKRQGGRGLITAGAIVVLLLLVAGAALWEFRAQLWSSTAQVPAPTPTAHNEKAPASVSARVEGPATTLKAALPPTGLKAFDGLWEFQLTGSEACTIKTLTFQRKILNGVVMAPNGKALGSISENGQFHARNPSLLNRSVMVESEGTIGGETGEGSYRAIGTPCHGSYKIRLLVRLFS